MGGNLYAQEKAPAVIAKSVPPKNDMIWVKRCDDIKDGEKVTGKYCEAVQSLSVVKKDADPSTAQRVAEIAIGYPPGNKGKPSAAVILPLGVLVQNDVELDIDGTKLLTFNIRFCDNGGCIGILDLRDSDVEQLRKGKELTLKSQVVTGQPLVVTLSLTGLPNILDEIKAGK